MIDWKGVAQPALTRARYYSGAIDGDDGKLTYAALFAFAAQRPADAAITTLGLAASLRIKADPIAQPASSRPCETRVRRSRPRR